MLSKSTDDVFPFSTGDVILAKYNNKIFYAQIISVNYLRKIALLLFDNNSRDEIGFENIFSVNETTCDIICIVCREDKSEQDIVLCDSCSVGYHPKCHEPSISLNELLPDVPWQCRYCFCGGNNPFIETNPFKEKKMMLKEETRKKEGDDYTIDIFNAETSCKSNGINTSKIENSLKLIEQSNSQGFEDDLKSVVIKEEVLEEYDTTMQQENDNNDLKEHLIVGNLHSDAFKTLSDKRMRMDDMTQNTHTEIENGSNKMKENKQNEIGDTCSPKWYPSIPKNSLLIQRLKNRIAIEDQTKNYISSEVDGEVNKNSSEDSTTKLRSTVEEIPILVKNVKLKIWADDIQIHESNIRDYDDLTSQKNIILPEPEENRIIQDIPNERDVLDTHSSQCEGNKEIIKILTADFSLTTAANTEVTKQQYQPDTTNEFNNISQSEETQQSQDVKDTVQSFQTHSNGDIDIEESDVTESIAIALQPKFISQSPSKQYSIPAPNDLQTVTYNFLSYFAKSSKAKMIESNTRTPTKINNMRSDSVANLKTNAFNKSEDDEEIVPSPSRYFANRSTPSNCNAKTTTLNDPDYTISPTISTNSYKTIIESIDKSDHNDQMRRKIPNADEIIIKNQHSYKKIDKDDSIGGLRDDSRNQHFQFESQETTELLKNTDSQCLQKSNECDSLEKGGIVTDEENSTYSARNNNHGSDFSPPSTYVPYFPRYIAPKKPINFGQSLSGGPNNINHNRAFITGSNSNNTGPYLYNNNIRQGGVMNQTVSVPSGYNFETETNRNLSNSQNIRPNCFNLEGNIQTIPGINRILSDGDCSTQNMPTVQRNAMPNILPFQQTNDQQININRCIGNTAAVQNPNVITAIQKNNQQLLAAMSNNGLLTAIANRNNVAANIMNSYNALISTANQRVITSPQDMKRCIAIQQQLQKQKQWVSHQEVRPYTLPSDRNSAHYNPGTMQLNRNQFRNHQVMNPPKLEVITSLDNHELNKEIEIDRRIENLTREINILNDQKEMLADKNRNEIIINKPLPITIDHNISGGYNFNDSSRSRDQPPELISTRQSHEYSSFNTNDDDLPRRVVVKQVHSSPLKYYDDQEDDIIQNQVQREQNNIANQIKRNFEGVRKPDYGDVKRLRRERELPLLEEISSSNRYSTDNTNQTMRSYNLQNTFPSREMSLSKNQPSPPENRLLHEGNFLKRNSNESFYYGNNKYRRMSPTTPIPTYQIKANYRLPVEPPSLQLNESPYYPDENHNRHPPSHKPLSPTSTDSNSSSTNEIDRQSPSNSMNKKYRSIEHCISKDTSIFAETLPKDKICLLCGEQAQFLCSICRSIWYCGQKCQLTHWQAHAKACKVFTPTTKLQQSIM